MNLLVQKSFWLSRAVALCLAVGRGTAPPLPFHPPARGVGDFPLQAGGAVCPCPVPSSPAHKGLAVGLRPGSSDRVNVPWDGGSMFCASMSSRAEDGYPHILPSCARDVFLSTNMQACLENGEHGVIRAADPASFSCFYWKHKAAVC